MVEDNQEDGHRPQPFDIGSEGAVPRGGTGLVPRAQHPLGRWGSLGDGHDSDASKVATDAPGTLWCRSREREFPAAGDSDRCPSAVGMTTMLRHALRPGQGTPGDSRATLVGSGAVSGQNARVDPVPRSETVEFKVNRCDE